MKIFYKSSNVPKIIYTQEISYKFTAFGYVSVYIVIKGDYTAINQLY